MKTTLFTQTSATIALTAALCGALPAAAQVAGGTTTVDARIIESTQITTGWSVKKTLMNKSIYNDTCQKVGNVDDLIISPDKKVTYIIIGAGGFVGIGRHDEAIPVAQIQDQSGRLVMAGATKEMIKSMPEFTYAVDTGQRDRFVAAAEKDIASGKLKITDLEKKAATSTTAAQAKIDAEITTLQPDIKSAEAKLSEMKKVAAVRWKEFEASISAAIAHMRKSIEAATA